MNEMRKLIETLGDIESGGPYNTVYVVIGHDWDDHEVYGVFTSKDLAMEARADLRADGLPVIVVERVLNQVI